MKRTILIKEVKYSNQAKILLGMMKMTQVVTKNMVTIHLVSNSSTSMLVHTMKNGSYSKASTRPRRDLHTYGRRPWGSLHLPRTGLEC